jgi:hypothetical protein
MTTRFLRFYLGNYEEPDMVDLTKANDPDGRIRYTGGKLGQNVSIQENPDGSFFVEYDKETRSCELGRCGVDGWEYYRMVLYTEEGQALPFVRFISYSPLAEFGPNEKAVVLGTDIDQSLRISFYPNSRFFNPIFWKGDMYFRFDGKRVEAEGREYSFERPGSVDDDTYPIYVFLWYKAPFRRAQPLQLDRKYTPRDSGYQEYERTSSGGSTLVRSYQDGNFKLKVGNNGEFQEIKAGEAVSIGTTQFFLSDPDATEDAGTRTVAQRYPGWVAGGSVLLAAILASIVAIFVVDMKKNKPL